jgi:hypothetical protein
MTSRKSIKKKRNINQGGFSPAKRFILLAHNECALIDDCPSGETSVSQEAWSQKEVSLSIVLDASVNPPIFIRLGYQNAE